jgi:FlaA1/EpsC-like NDP-sugar epimerase
MPHLRNRHLLVADSVLLGMAAWLAFLARFEGALWPEGIAALCRAYVLLSVPVKLFVLWRAGTYSRLWRYAGIRDLEVLAGGIAGVAVAGAVTGLVVCPVLFGARVPIAVLALDALIAGAAIATTRLLVRIVWRGRRANGQARRAVIVGAGAAGSLIVRELLESRRLHVVPVAFVDDDADKQGRTLHGVRVAGRLADLAAVVETYRADEVIIAMPSAAGAVVREVVRAASAAGMPTRTVPGLFELIQGHKNVSALRKVAIEDLLCRDPVLTDLARVSQLATGKVVLVTGAGGSIGSELCRQIARLQPARLIAVGRGENSVFELLQELTTACPELAAVEPVIADVRDRTRLERVFRAYRPSTVFHAAAHKHVPLMEQNVSEAILNNVLGTRVVAELAAAYGAERFVLISSDKAVRPSSVMGATKRLAEGVVQAIAAQSSCRFVSVRFGNVLGSRGSVIPTFLRQIRAGGPVTVTHPEMVRYFMTIPEAVQLVLQAGVMGEGGEVFVLDMGKPVRVVDLARDLIRLSGLNEGDVEIRFTGMRPGEKLYEELFFDEENAEPTEHPKVLRAKNAALEFHGRYTVDDLLADARDNLSADDLRRGIRRLVPEYTGTFGGRADDAPRPAPDAGRGGTPREVVHPPAAVARGVVAAGGR